MNTVAGGLSSWLFSPLSSLELMAIALSLTVKVRLVFGRKFTVVFASSML